MRRQKMKGENTKTKSIMQPNMRLISVLLALLLAACVIATSACSTKALPPKLYIGDHWIYQRIEGGITYTQTETVMGEERIEGNDCYVVRFTFAPPYAGLISELTEWRDKATDRQVQRQYSWLEPSIGNETVKRLVKYSNQVTGNEWPYKLGNEFTVKQSWNLLDVVEHGNYTGNYTQSGSSVTTYKVTKTEEIEVGSGNLTCFKTVAYQGGNATFEYWYSDKAKAYAKEVSLDNGLTDELLSYSVR
jgi:hypothetical protein